MMLLSTMPPQIGKVCIREESYAKVEEIVYEWSQWNRDLNLGLQIFCDIILDSQIITESVIHPEII